MNFKKYLNKKNISNLLFIIAMAVMLYPPSREWVMRQVAFSPKIKSVENSDKLTSYNWQLKGLNTGDIDFENLKGKIIFVNFWATWCPPCRAELPMIQKFYDDYNGKIEFILVTNESWSTVEKFFNEKQYNLPVFNSINVPPSNFTKTNSIPASYLIDEDGNVVIEKVGAANWKSDSLKKYIEEHLK